jgi:indole-3-glycerol phosphate synthase
MFLEKIIKHKREEYNKIIRMKSLQELKVMLSDIPPSRDFRKSLMGDNIHIIAEIKKASPSRGIIRNDFEPVEIAKIYESNGASALSVLTDSYFFHGSIDYLPEIKEAVNIPILRKDFIIDEYQIYETRLYRGDALLLIATVLDDYKLKDFMDITNELGLSYVVEVHDIKDLERVLPLNPEIIGINNRDLNTFNVDIKRSFELVKYIPENIIVISESGISNIDDIIALKDKGINIFLIGEGLIKERDIGRKLRSLLVKDTFYNKKMFIERDLWRLKR